MESNTKNPKREQSNQEMLTQQGVPNYLKKLNSKPTNRKVGQTFVTFTKKESADTINTTKK